jgi:hypothetical protein
VSEEICLGPCNNAWRRAWARYQAAVNAHDAETCRRVEAGLPTTDPPGPPELRPWAGVPVWCSSCQAVIRAELSDLDDLGSQLAALPPGIRPATEWGTDGIKVSGSKGTPSPSPSADALDELVGWLRWWETAAKGDHVRPRRGFLSTERHQIVCTLVDFYDVLMSRVDDPDTGGGAKEFGEGVRAWHRVLVRTVHAGHRAKHVNDRCPGCKQYTLWDYPGEDYLRCINTTCNAAPTREEASDAA